MLFLIPKLYFEPFYVPEPHFGGLPGGNLGVPEPCLGGTMVLERYLWGFGAPGTILGSLSCILGSPWAIFGLLKPILGSTGKIFGPQGGF